MTTPITDGRAVTPAAAPGRLSPRRLPLRMRLVVGFSAAITVVLMAAGAFVYWRVSYALDLRLDSDAGDAAASLLPLITTDGTLRADPGTADTPASRLYQLLDSTGRILSAGPDLATQRVVTPADS